MRRFVGAFVLATTVACGGSTLGADLSSGPFCLPEKVGRDFLKIEYSDITLLRETADARVYRGTKDGVIYTISMDACSTEVLSTAPV